MALRHRKLIPESSNSTAIICRSFCDSTNDSGYCISRCLTFCPDTCYYSVESLNDQGKKPNTFLIVGSSLVVATVLLVGLFVFYVKYYSNRRRSRSQPQQQEDRLSDETHDDEDHGPVIDHHIWYINTVGLQQSIISSIAVCQYNKSDGLVEGTECSVCLGEFQEDENLRLLPKCNHAFHIPCIDTWLRSHTNCPMCRAPIVKSLGTPESEPTVALVDDSSPADETQVEILETIGESTGGMENETSEVGVETEENREDVEKRRSEIPIEEVNGVVIGPRRSVSMDSLSASKIILAISKVTAVESDRSLNTKLVQLNKLHKGVVPKRTCGNQKLQRHKGSSSKGGSLAMKRSSSCNGKFTLCRDIENCDSVFPLRSF